MTFRSALLTIRNIALRAYAAFVDDRNVEWFRVRLNPAIVIDRARAHAAIVEVERCFAIERAGQTCRRFGRKR